MNAVRFTQPRASDVPRRTEPPPALDLDYAFLAFDPRSPLSFLERFGIILWLGGSGRNEFL
jgi:hypothetical protein